MLVTDGSEPSYFFLIPKTLMFKILFQLVSLYGCETWSVTQREEHNSVIASNVQDRISDAGEME
jgi:hypothetical protein